MLRDDFTYKCIFSRGILPVYAGLQEHYLLIWSSASE
jgi:hypothetical protein